MAYIYGLYSHGERVLAAVPGGRAGDVGALVRKHVVVVDQLGPRRRRHVAADVWPHVERARWCGTVCGRSAT